MAKKFCMATDTTMRIEWRQLSPRHNTRNLSHCYVNGVLICKCRIKRDTVQEVSPMWRCRQCQHELHRIQRGEREL